MYAPLGLAILLALVVCHTATGHYEWYSEFEGAFL